MQRPPHQDFKVPGRRVTIRNISQVIKIPNIDTASSSDMARLKAHDIDADTLNGRIQRGASGNIVLGVFPEHFGDIEVAFRFKTVRDLQFF
jgi:hypothetical protein